MRFIPLFKPLSAGKLPVGECLDSRHNQPRRKHFGQTTVEFAIICLPFFAILFAILDYAQIYFYENSIQNAMREATRFATAGRIIPVYNTDGSPAYETNAGIVMPKAINDPSGREASRNECIRYWFNSNCVVQLPLSAITIVSAPTLPGAIPITSTNSAGKLRLTGGYDTNAGSTNTVTATVGPGAANDYVEVSVRYTVPTITPLFSYLGGYSRGGQDTNGGFLIIASAIVKNEPALLNFLHTNIYPGEPYDSAW